MFIRRKFREVSTMLLGKYSISSHAIKQYSRRIRPRGEIVKSIKTDLRTLNIKNIIYDKDKIYIFTWNYKEFIFAKRRDGCLCLKTVIKRNFEDTKLAIEKRKILVNH